MEEREYFVYIMSNRHNTCLYVGVTNDLMRRVFEHKSAEGKGAKFTAQYKCNKLVYFESGGDIIEAINREKSLKNWHRQWKKNLITEMNPDWRDLSEDFTEP